MLQDLPVAARPALSEPQLRCIVMKLQLSFPWALPTMPHCFATPELHPVHETCDCCNQQLRPVSSFPATVLSYANGLETIRVHLSRCPLCSWYFLGSWKVRFLFFHRSVLCFLSSFRLRLEAHPKNLAKLYAVAPPCEASYIYTQALRKARAGAISGIDAKLFRFTTLLLVHGDVSFTGMALVWRSFFSMEYRKHLQEQLLLAWYFIRSLTIAWDMEASALKLIGFVFDRNAVNDVRRCMAVLYPILRKWFLERYARAHRCEKCEKAECVGFDLKQSFTTSTCAYPHGERYLFRGLSTSLRYHCAGRPISKRGSRPASAFCCSHSYLDPRFSDAPDPKCEQVRVTLFTFQISLYVFHFLAGASVARVNSK